ncbi:MAG TPA: ABC transporter permease [Gemmatimonadaceae bacterium]|nr:ABC transporter permease [Gemmatimonadaceae bacterium]
MRRLIVRRALTGVVMVFVVATLAFVLLHLAPGDPLAVTLDRPYVTPAVRAAWRHTYGLDRPLGAQYLLYLRDLARGDLGYSFSLRRPVAAALAVALPRTLLLMSLALAVSFVGGVAVGLFQARRHGSPADHAAGGVMLAFYSVPDFWLAIIMMLVFAYWLPFFPTSGMVDPVIHPYLGFWGRMRDLGTHLVLPVATLALLSAAAISRFQRAAALDVSRQDYVRTARAKGVPERSVFLRHILRNALLPVITLLGLAFPALLGGSVFVEQVFAWPGMGYLTVNAVAARDYPLVTAVVVVGSALVVVGNLLADLLYAWVDPRLRTS